MRACFASEAELPAPLLLFADAVDALSPCALGKQTVMKHDNSAQSQVTTAAGADAVTGD